MNHLTCCISLIVGIPVPVPVPVLAPVWNFYFILSSSPEIHSLKAPLSLLFALHTFYIKTKTSGFCEEKTIQNFILSLSKLSFWPTCDVIVCGKSFLFFVCVFFSLCKGEEDREEVFVQMLS